MLPQFSTSEQTNDISGRGMGMDIIDSNIKTLGGKLTIHTEIGKYTEFRIILKQDALS